MIEGISKTEANYRNVMLDSSSSLKDFSQDRKKYYRKYILGETVEDKDSQASVMGKLVETLLMEPHLFDCKFHMSACATTPTGMMLDFVEALYTATRNATDDYGNVTRSFEDMSREAYEKAGYKIKYEQVISKFIGSDAEIYYNEIRQIRAKNLTVVTADDVAKAEQIVDELRNNPVTRDIVNLQESHRYMVRNQMQVEGYEVDGHMLKSMLDKVIIDHRTKTVRIYDLKCVWSVENFYEEYYLFRRAYIQGYVYYRAMEHFVKTSDQLKGYKVELPRFLVCDSTNYFNPLIYEMTRKDIDDAYNGFDYKGRTYPGVKQIIKDLAWALDTNTWNMSRKNAESNGVVKLTE